MRTLLAVAACLLVPVAATAATARPLVLDEHGVGGLTLGRSLAAIRAAHLIGKTTPGCELASPRPTVAKLTKPLQGSATFTKKKLTALSVTGGAVTDRGIGIGATAAKVLKAYPTAQTLDQTGPLVIHAIVVKRAGNDRIWFMLTKHGGRVTSFDLPTAQACE